MSWMEFVADLVGHLTWPIALIVLAVVFRKPLAALIGDVSEAEAGAGGIKFKRARQRTAEAVARAEASSQAGPEQVSAADPLPAAPRDDTDEEEGPRPSPYESYHAVTQPELAIQGAARQVADRLRELLGDTTTGPIGRTADIAALGRRARHAGLIPPDVLDSVEGLSVMHDLAQSAPERVTPAQAQEFQVLVKAVLYTLSDRRLGRITTQPP